MRKSGSESYTVYPPCLQNVKATEERERRRKEGEGKGRKVAGWRSVVKEIEREKSYELCMYSSLTTRPLA